MLVWENGLELFGNEFRKTGQIPCDGDNGDFDREDAVRAEAGGEPEGEGQGVEGGQQQTGAADRRAGAGEAAGQPPRQDHPGPRLLSAQEGEGGKDDGDDSWRD